MLEITPPSPVYRIIQPEKIKKNDPFSARLQHKKKQVLEEQKTQPVQHIDEMV